MSSLEKKLSESKHEYETKISELKTIIKKQ
jgi:hypothetical protein